LFASIGFSNALTRGIFDGPQMTTRSQRLTLIASAVTLCLVGAGVLAAHAWNRPVEEEREGPAAAALPSAPPPRQPASRRVSSFGALLLDLRSHGVETARLEEPPLAATESPPTETQEPLASAAPLPPARPDEFAYLTEVEAPLPPLRPRDLAVAPLTVVETPETSPPSTTSLAALPTEPEPNPLPRRQDGDFRFGANAFVRIFKKEGELELWLKRGGRYALYRTYPICKWSGHLGPKLHSGDYQSPEGFYSVSARQLNPNSAYHRAFNIGFPNAFDRQNGRTGGALMVHGACKSVGCFAMTDKVIDEIYGFVAAAIQGGQRDVPVHIFPFRMTDTAFERETKGDWTSLWAVSPLHQQWSSFWQNLKEGYDLFEQTGEPPAAYACRGRYAFGSATASCTRIAGW
jgi:hypothetical protein